MPGNAGRLGSGPGVALGLFVLGHAGLAPLVLGSNNPATWMFETALIAAAACAYLLASPQAGRDLRYGTLGWLALPLLLYPAIQLLPLGFPSPDPDVPGTGTISLAPGDTSLALVNLAGFGLFALLVRLAARHPGRRRLLLLGGFAVAVGYAVLGLGLLRAGDTLLFVDKFDYRGLATATFVNRNSYATFLAMGFAVGLAWTLGHWSGGRGAVTHALGGVAAMIGLVVIIGALLATNSRMGLLAWLAGALVVLSMWGLGTRGTKWRLLAVALAGLVAVAVMFVLLGTGMVGRAIDASGDFGGRLELYRQVAGMIAARPLTGFGLHAFEVAFPLFHELPLAADATIENAHSTYLALWVELGLVVGTLPMLMAALMFGRAVRAALQPDADWTVPAAVAGVVAVAAVHSIVDFSLEIQANAYYLIFIAMLLPAPPPGQTKR